MIVARIPDDASSIRIQDVSITLGPHTCPTFLPVDSPTPCVDRPSDRGNRAVYHYFSKSRRGGGGGEDRFSEFRQQISIPGGFLNLFQIVVNIRYVETGVSIPAISTIILVYFWIKRRDDRLERNNRSTSYRRCFEMKFVDRCSLVLRKRTSFLFEERKRISRIQKFCKNLV